jgi:hypothetical protein
VKPADIKVSRSLARPKIFAEIKFRDAVTCTAAALLREARTPSLPRFSTLRESSRIHAPRPRSKLCHFQSPCSSKFRRLHPEQVELRAGFSRLACPATLNLVARSSLRSRVVSRLVRCAPAISYADMSRGTVPDRACGLRRCFLRTYGELRPCQLRIPAPPSH